MNIPDGGEQEAQEMVVQRVKPGRQKFNPILPATPFSGIANEGFEMAELMVSVDDQLPRRPPPSARNGKEPRARGHEDLSAPSKQAAALPTGIDYSSTVNVNDDGMEAGSRVVGGGRGNSTPTIVVSDFGGASDSAVGTGTSDMSNGSLKRLADAGSKKRVVADGQTRREPLAFDNPASTIQEE